MQVPRALNREQLGAMIGSADASNPSVVAIAAYVANTSVESDRAVTQCFLEWHEVVVQLDSDGLIVGSAIRKTKLYGRSLTLLGIIFVIIWIGGWG